MLCCQSLPPPTPFLCTISPRRPMWSHTGFPKSLQVLSGRSSDQRSSLQKPDASRMSLSVEINRSKVAAGYTVGMACGEPFYLGTFCHGNEVPWERFATRGALVYFGNGVGWFTVATAHARPPPARLRVLTRMRSIPASGLQGVEGDGANNAKLPGIPTRSDVRVANFRASWF